MLQRLLVNQEYQTRLAIRDKIGHGASGKPEGFIDKLCALAALAVDDGLLAVNMHGGVDALPDGPGRAAFKLMLAGFEPELLSMICATSLIGAGLSGEGLMIQTMAAQSALMIQSGCKAIELRCVLVALCCPKELDTLASEVMIIEGKGRN